MREMGYTVRLWAARSLRNGISIGLAALMLAVLAPASALAQATPGTPMVSGAVIRDYARLTFHWPNRVDTFSANLSGNRLTVNFDRPVNPNFGQILRTLYPYVMKAELSTDQRTIIFTLNSTAYTTRTFITDAETGVDILGVDKPPVPPSRTTTAESQPPQIPASAPPQPAPTAAPSQAETTVAWRNPPVPREKPPVRVYETTESQTPPTPAPTSAPTPAAPSPSPVVPPVVATPAQAPVTAPAPAVPEKAVPVVDVAEKPLAAPATVTPSPSGITLSGLSTRELLKRDVPAAAAISGEPLAVGLTVVNKQPSLNFPFTERVAAATWMRGRTAWILFDKPRRVTGLPEVRQASAGWLTGIQQYGSENYTLLRLDLLTDVYVKMEKDPSNYGWNLRISSSPVVPEHPLLPEVVTREGMVSAYLAVGEAAGPFTIYDPVMDDMPRVVPLYASATGVRPPRQFVEFLVPATVQGIVVLPSTEKVEVSRDEQGVYVSVAAGMTISKEARNADAESIMAGDEKLHLFAPTLFPYRNWAVEDETDFLKKERFFLRQATEAENLNEKNQWRQKLAELYFGQGMANEALGVLGRIRNDDIEYFRAQKLAAMEGAAHLLKYRLPEAELSLTSDALKGDEEADLLLKTVRAMQDPLADPVPYMQMNDSFIRQYPPTLRQRLAIIAANQAIQKRDLKTPVEIFNSLQEDKVSREIEDYLSFLQGKVSSEMGRVNEAEKIWKDLANKVEDRQFRARAEFALVLLQLREEQITPEEALKRLDRLRIVWRGDDLERSLLMLVGQLNTNLGNYWDGMKAWEELMQYYPNTPEASEAYQRLVETFRMVFLDGGVKDMDPVKALALYSEFQELTPLGADGIRMVQNLVDQLVSVDLLDQAAERLQGLVEYRLQGEEKSKGGARLAVIHLLNREPEKAISALQMSRDENASAALIHERNRIAAQALIDLKRYDQALTMIEGDYTPEGESVRLEAYTRKEDWAYAADILENTLRSRPELDAPFTTEQGQQLVQLTLAYIFLGEAEQLSYLREAYAPLMANNKFKDEFLFLTQETPAVGSANFQKVSESISNMRSFMDHYRNRLKTESLSQAVGNESAAAPATPNVAPQPNNAVEPEIPTIPTTPAAPSATPNATNSKAGAGNTGATPAATEEEDGENQAPVGAPVATQATPPSAPAQ